MPLLMPFTNTVNYLLRVFEAARIATAQINGCQICMNWQTNRDIKQMGIEGGVTLNGEPPDENFYAHSFTR